jgi:ankyrin repeat protein
MGPIHFACQSGNVDCVDILVKKGCLKDLPGRNRMTGLMIAASLGNYDVVEYLVKSGAKINAKDKTKKTALLYAVKNSQAVICNFLLR